MELREVEEKPHMFAVEAAAEFIGIEPERMELAINRYKRALETELARLKE